MSSSEPYASQAEAWNEALEKAAQIVERYNANFPDPEAGGAPEDIRALKQKPIRDEPRYTVPLRTFRMSVPIEDLRGDGGTEV